MKKSKKTKRISFFKIVIVILVVYSFGSAANLQFQVSGKQNELENTLSLAEQQLAENKDLEDLLNADRNSYLVQVAREKFGYAYPEERIYIDISGK